MWLLGVLQAATISALPVPTCPVIVAASNTTPQSNPKDPTKPYRKAGFYAKYILKNLPLNSHIQHRRIWDPNAFFDLGFLKKIQGGWVGCRSLRDRRDSDLVFAGVSCFIRTLVGFSAQDRRTRIGFEAGIWRGHWPQWLTYTVLRATMALRGALSQPLWPMALPYGHNPGLQPCVAPICVCPATPVLPQCCGFGLAATLYVSHSETYCAMIRFLS